MVIICDLSIRAAKIMPPGRIGLIHESFHTTCDNGTGNKGGRMKRGKHKKSRGGRLQEATTVGSAGSQLQSELSRNNYSQTTSLSRSCKSVCGKEETNGEARKWERHELKRKKNNTQGRRK